MRLGIRYFVVRSFVGTREEDLASRRAARNGAGNMRVAVSRARSRCARVSPSQSRPATRRVCITRVLRFAARNPPWPCSSLPEPPPSRRSCVGYFGRVGFNSIRDFPPFSDTRGVSRATINRSAVGRFFLFFFFAPNLRAIAEGKGRGVREEDAFCEEKKPERRGGGGEESGKESGTPRVVPTSERIRARGKKKSRSQSNPRLITIETIGSFPVVSRAQTTRCVAVAFERYMIERFTRGEERRARARIRFRSARGAVRIRFRRTPEEYE